MNSVRTFLLQCKRAVAEFAVAPLNRFSTQEQALLSKRLSFLVKAGVPIHECLALISHQTTSTRKQRILNTVMARVSAGQLLSTSLASYISPYATNIIQVGEHTGTLSENLTYLSDELAKKHVLRRKVLSALIYPSFVTIATLGVTTMLIVFLFPKLTPIFLSLNVELPLTTKALLRVSRYLEHWGALTLIMLVLTVMALIAMHRVWKPLRGFRDWLLIHLPFFGRLTQTYNAANFCRVLRLNIHAGVHVAESITLAANATENSVYRKVYHAVADDVLRGHKISESLATHGDVLPTLLPQMIFIGESTGNLTQTLMYLSELYESELDEQTKNLSNSVEPFLLILMGVLVGIIAVSVIMPIYGITRHLHAV